MRARQLLWIGFMLAVVAPVAAETPSVGTRGFARLRGLVGTWTAQRNQPRLSLRDDAGGKRVFEFVDATNLAADASHLHRLELDVADPARLVESETYRTASKDETETFQLARARPASR